MYFFFLMIRRPPRSTQGVSSAASDVYKRQVSTQSTWGKKEGKGLMIDTLGNRYEGQWQDNLYNGYGRLIHSDGDVSVSYTHLRAHETSLHLVCRLLLEKKKKKINERSQKNKTY
eukprot:TRINITY_DN35123_c0_g1_i1.p3 TRINITY_DN35123_c0_g1~~TRINITY_DN35123_c0_g1_i1.p3  ORF type:complete len:115 (-),score=40.70 TRINITY_DN35123_c0_g1_i1:41-385(-)